MCVPHLPCTAASRTCASTGVDFIVALKKLIGYVLRLAAGQRWDHSMYSKDGAYTAAFFREEFRNYRLAGTDAIPVSRAGNGPASSM